ncbi:FecCD family ABC transporter permease [Ensifer adhaerens]|uniref:FecCD family ABC transporter permease n=1 Tax=Ensifer adhaerens TaxID=106592 RepID=UPI003D05A106
MIAPLAADDGALGMGDRASIRAVGSGCRRRAGLLLPALLGALGVLVVVLAASILTGPRSIDLATGIQAFVAYDATNVDHVVVRAYRVPRMLLGLLCGSAFGVAGALIQAMTRNPLADPGLLGVNAGAAFFVTLAVGVFGWHSISAYMWFALFGAIVVATLVHTIGTAGRGGAEPARLILAGVALSAVLGGLGMSISLIDPTTFNGMRHWAIGSIGGRDMTVVLTAAPVILLGLVLAVAVAGSLNSIALGDDLAQAFGTRLAHLRIGVVVAVTLLAGGATAAAGPITFVGLMVPHAVRLLTGPDQRWIIAFTIVLSPILLLGADLAGRFILYPDELEAGILTACIGAPVLILLARRREALAS